MTDDRVASLAERALQQPAAQARTASLAFKHLRQMRAIVPADARVASAGVQVAQYPDPDARVYDLALQVLRQLPAELPDNGLPFQWHQLDAAGRRWTAPVERSTALAGYTCSYGRSAPNGAVPPTSLTCTLAARHTTAPEIGELFRIAVAGTLTEGDQRARVRFTGEVTDVVHDPAGDDGRGLITVTAVGRLARRGARQLDLIAAPVELDGARVVRVLRAAGVEVGLIDGGQALLSAHPSPSAGAQLLDEVTTSTAGLVVEQRDGTVDYHDAEHRRGAEPVIELGADELLSSFTWTKRLGDLVNVARITYGREPAATVEVRDSGSVDDHAERVEERTTLLRTSSAAYDLGSTIVGRRSTPAWQLPTVTVDLLRTITPTKRATLLGLAVADRLTLTGLPAGGDYTAAELFVEGATETAQVLAGEVLPTIERTRWQLTLAVADPAASGTTLRWSDVPTATTWDTTDPGLSWLDLARAEQPDALNPTTT